MKRPLLFVLFLALMILPVLCCNAMAEEIDVDLSLDSGFYADEMLLEITCNSNDVDIYYTVDGSMPDESDLAYEGPIRLTSTVNKPDLLNKILDTNTEENKFEPWKDFPSAHVIRAAALYADGTVADTCAGTFFIGFDRQETYGDLAIVSLIMEYDDLFDYDTGIYVLGATYEEWDAEQEEPYEAWQTQGNFSNRGMEWERPVVADFILEDESFSQNMGVRIKGGTSRSAAQKSLRLIARDEYGKRSIKHALYPNNICEETGEVLDRYKAVTLRNGGNDRDNTKIRDPFITQLAEGLEMETAAVRPVVGFINGEYWGMYTLTEEFNDNYFQHHYGLNNENVMIMKNNELKDGDEEGIDEDLYWEMFDFILYEDMADPDTYAQAADMLDMKSFADYVAVALYIDNMDGIFQNNNWMMWRVRDTELSDHPLSDGKWRMILFDTDYSSDVYGDGGSYSQDTISDPLLWAEYDEMHLAALVKSLMNNEDFVKELLLSMSDVRNLYFTKTRAKALLKEMTAQYQPYMDDTFLRFGPFWVAEWNLKTHYKDKLRQMGVYFEGRYERFSDIVAKAFEMETPVNVNLKLSDGTKGSVILNNRDDKAFSETLETKIFSEYAFTLTAAPKDGAAFKGWESNNKKVVFSDPTALTTTVTVTDSCAITAVFE